MHQRRIDLTVGACIVYEQKILLLFHKKLQQWLFPGGHIESNETPDRAVLREVKEETGLDFQFLQCSPLEQSLEEIEKLAVPFHANLHSVGDHDHYCSYYLGTASHDQYQINNESKALRWFTRSQLQDLEGILPSIKKMAFYALEKAEELGQKFIQ
ncbi:MAG: NUDIX domain-containing protein [Nanoarchaeota archaeon]